MKKRYFWIFAVVCVFFVSCNNESLDISGKWNNSLKYKTELPSDLSDPDSPVGVVFYTEQTCEYDFPVEKAGRYRANITTKLGTIEYPGKKPDGIDFDSLPLVLNHTAYIEGDFEIRGDMLNLQPDLIYFDGNENDPMSFEDFSMMNPNVELHRGLGKVIMDGNKMTVGNLTFVKEEK